MVFQIRTFLGHLGIIQRSHSGLKTYCVYRTVFTIRDMPNRGYGKRLHNCITRVPDQPFGLHFELNEELNCFQTLWVPTKDS